MERQGSVSAEQSFAAMNAVTSLVVAATGAEMRAAAYGIAQAVRGAHPSATHVLLEQSDQGDWLTLSGWYDVLAADQHEVETGWDEEVWSAPAHLYTAHIGFTPDGGTVSGLWCTDRRAGRYLLDIAQVLAEVTMPGPPLTAGSARRHVVPDRLAGQGVCPQDGKRLRDALGES